MNIDESLLRTVLEYYGLDDAAIHPIHVGNINRSFLIVAADGTRLIMQRVNPLFPPAVHDDIEAVTAHLQEKGMLTPRLVRTRTGSLYMEAEGNCWRLFNYIEGIICEQVESEAVAHGAASLLGRFHHALLDLEHEFRSVRAAVHDTPQHLDNLRAALAAHTEHPRYNEAAALATGILELAAALPDLPPVAARTVHGDPKITNVIFDAAVDRALCLIDLDTLGPMPLYLELGDALRSWCNPAGEDTEETFFSLSLFQAAVQGYAGETSGFILEPEWRSILPATYRICLELAARFCADILNESYFNWDTRRFPGRSEHNLVRAAGQLQVARSLHDQYARAEQVLERAFEKD